VASTSLESTPTSITQSQSLSPTEPSSPTVSLGVLENKQLMMVIYCSFVVVLLLGICLGLAFARWQRLHSAKSTQIHVS
jgi:hypothetical protein